MKVDVGNTQKIDLLNIGLILLSLIVAFKIPFELFLFSYAVLGPLHYVTEINWLKEKNYFVKERKWIWLFVLLAIYLGIPIIFSIPQLSVLHLEKRIGGLYKLQGEVFYAILLSSFVFAISLVYLHKWQHIVVSLLVNVVLMIGISQFKWTVVAALGIFLPTIVHVYLFTLLFMIFGTLKSGNKAGIMASILLVLCPIIIWNSSINELQYQIPLSTQTAFSKSDFNKLNAYIGRMLGTMSPNGKFNLLSEEGIKIQIFIAFCYTYHYLNWFSKTTIIKWNAAITKPKMLLIVGIWLLSVGLYSYDYKVGFAMLFVLSMIHVFFEFPLNVISIQGIFAAFWKRVAPNG